MKSNVSKSFTSQIRAIIFFEAILFNSCTIWYIFIRNSIPPTTTVENLLLKQQASHGKICIDVGFWGGIVPGNGKELPKLISEGVIGLKCFLHPSGDETFSYVTEEEVEIAFQHLVDSDALVAVCTLNFSLFHFILTKKILSENDLNSFMQKNVM